jgi:sterol desaturase/sphingolipid hydroxylase (fatty acid hydroxylase superfamily)
MPAERATRVSALLILPAVFVAFYLLRVGSDDYAINEWFPQWYTLSIIITMILLEQVYTYARAVSQRPMLRRDISSTLVNLFVTGAVTAALLVPVLVLLPQFFVGRDLFFASPQQLGPFWLQVPVTLLFISFFRYWMHRLQHRVSFLWKLHSYHHRVTDLKASNLLVSHPVDFALRNVLPFLVLGIIGFDPLAILIGVSAVRVSSAFSHCGGDVKGGILNYVFVTPEVHRWHHSAEVPAGHRYSVNYGVGLSVWDILFGTFHLPRTEGRTGQPEQIGHPDGLADERSYLKLLLEPLGLYRPRRRLKRA